ncbi:MAG: 5'-nucleotidase C-terminal domain-containing protein [Oscillospiraceae bacterium]|nr:5'-nucleotidase C-terminal domain-containing protein [Oscillospiraceae bacterium]
MKKSWIQGAALCLLAVLLSASLLPAGVSAAPGEPVTLTVIHVNDRHGRMDADPFIAQLAQETPGRVLILDAGDALDGQIAANLTRGASMVDLMNAVGYSAMVTGNHEYTYGVDRLRELAGRMDFPLLAANVKQDGKPVFQAYAVFDLDGLRAGVFGIVTPETVSASDPRVVAGLTFEDPARTAAAMVEVLRAEDCDVVIALAHLGDAQSSRPEHRSGALAIPGVDVVIDGHSHSLLENGTMIHDTLIAQAGEYGRHIGVVELVIDGGVISKTARLIETGGDRRADEGILALIAELDKSVEDIAGQAAGYTPVPLHGERAEVRAGETNLANLITDSMRHATGADIAVLTGGNIRAGIPAGEITMGHVLTTLPFSNLLVTVRLSGADILEALEHGVSLYPEPAGQYIQVSGLSVEFDPDAEPLNRVTRAALADGSALDREKIYTVATIEFLAAGGDGYSMFDKGAGLVYYGGDAEAFAAYLESGPVIAAEAEGRVKASGTPEEPSGTDGSGIENPKTGGGFGRGMYMALISLGAAAIGLLLSRAARK